MGIETPLIYQVFQQEGDLFSQEIDETRKVKLLTLTSLRKVY